MSINRSIDVTTPWRWPVISVTSVATTSSNYEHQVLLPCATSASDTVLTLLLLLLLLLLPAPLLLSMLLL
jgi:hypothetical protein